MEIDAGTRANEAMETAGEVMTMGGFGGVLIAVAILAVVAVIGFVVVRAIKKRKSNDNDK